MTDLKAIDSVMSELLDFEEPLREAESLVHAASMAATAIADKDQRAAMLSLLEKAFDAVKKTHAIWDRALKRRYGPKRKKPRKHTLAIVPADGAAS
jgi:hypothetical protein